MCATDTRCIHRSDPVSGHVLVLQQPLSRHVYRQRGHLDRVIRLAGQGQMSVQNLAALIVLSETKQKNSWHLNHSSGHIYIMTFTQDLQLFKIENNENFSLFKVSLSVYNICKCYERKRDITKGA